ncbi:MAG: hypothetical protein U0894_10120 [Pirellulales bacterium]
MRRQLRQLELAQRQLAEETEESALKQRQEIEEEIATAKRQLASLREQWEAEKLQSWRRAKAQRTDRVEPEFKQLDSSIKDKHLGRHGQEKDYQRLYELDVQRRKLQE